MLIRLTMGEILDLCYGVFWFWMRGLVAISIQRTFSKDLRLRCSRQLKFIMLSAELPIVSPWQKMTL
jgi:hypothetical protein